MCTSVVLCAELPSVDQQSTIVRKISILIASRLILEEWNLDPVGYSSQSTRDNQTVTQRTREQELTDSSDLREMYGISE